MFNYSGRLQQQSWPKKVARLMFFGLLLGLGFAISVGLVSLATLLLTKLFVATYATLPAWGFELLNGAIGLLLDWPWTIAALPAIFGWGPWLFNKSAWFLNVIPEEQSYGVDVAVMEAGSLFYSAPAIKIRRGTAHEEMDATGTAPHVDVEPLTARFK